MADFFAHGPYDSGPQMTPQRVETGTSQDYYSMMPPPSVHGVSTMPGRQLAPPEFENTSLIPGSQLPNAQDNLQAISMLFNTQMFSDLANMPSQAPSSTSAMQYTTPAPNSSLAQSTPTPQSQLSFTTAPPGLDRSSFITSNRGSESHYGSNPSYQTHSSHSSLSGGRLSFPQYNTTSMPSFSTSHSLLPDQFGAPPPSNTMGAARGRSFQGYRPPARQRPQPYSYGSDKAFNSEGYEPPVPNAENAVEERLIHDTTTAFRLAELNSPSNARPLVATRPNNNPRTLSLGASLGEEETEFKSAKRKRGADSEPLSTGDNDEPIEHDETQAASKPRKQHITSKKPARGTLTTEQRKQNHIASEQKRRWQIAHHISNMRQLVPSIQASGLAKSQEIHETANFVAKLIRENEKYKKLAEEPNG